MDFIRVTLVEEWDKKGSPSKLRKMPEHLPLTSPRLQRGLNDPIIY